MPRMKRIICEISPRHDKELEWLMDRWGLDRTNTIRFIIAEAYREARQKDQRAKEGKREGE